MGARSELREYSKGYMFILFSSHLNPCHPTQDSLEYCYRQRFVNPSPENLPHTFTESS